MVTGTELDETLCEELAARALAGDAIASRRLVEVLWPWLMVFVRSNRSMRSRADREDEVRNVVTQIVEKLLRRLSTYPGWRTTNREKSIADWLRILSKNAIRDYLRERLGPRPAPGEEPSAKRFLNDFTSWEQLEERGERPPRTLAETVRELLEFASAQLPAAQVSALARWLEGADATEIGEALSVPSAEAQRLVRAAVATLRRQFAGNDVH
jgi:DNA-directed RNA polymerase specialized sigma24 family protein